MPTPPKTPDGRYIVVNARKWRASDPSIPATLRQQLVNNLMSARRAIRSSTGDELQAVRRRVNDAKIALGERGCPWWAPTASGTRARIDATMRTLCRQRAPSTICPSEVARAVRGDETEEWRDLMEPVRDRARGMAGDEVVEICQKGERIDPEGEFRGPIRIRAGERIDELWGGMPGDEKGEGEGLEEGEGEGDEEEEAEAGEQEGGGEEENEDTDTANQTKKRPLEELASEVRDGETNEAPNGKPQDDKTNKRHAAPKAKRRKAEPEQPRRRSTRLRKKADQ